MLIDTFELLSQKQNEEGESEEGYFSHRGCDNCSSGLGNTVYDCIAFKTLEEAKENKENYYELQLCAECLNLYFNGE